MEYRSLFNRRELIGFVLRKSQFETGWRALLLLYLCLAGTVLIIFPFSKLEDGSAAQWLCGTGGVAYFVVFLLVWARNVAIPSHFLRCPICERSAEYGNRFVMIATGRCGCCGEGVFTEMPEPSQSPEWRAGAVGAPFERSSFLAHWQKKAKRGVWRATLALLLWLSGGALLRLFLAESVPRPFLAIPFLASTLLFFWIAGKLLMKVGHPFDGCPTCKKWLSMENLQIIRAAGRCGACGSPVVQAPGEAEARGAACPSEDKHGLLDRQKFMEYARERERNQRKTSWLFCLLMIAGTFAVAKLTKFFNAGPPGVFWMLFLLGYLVATPCAWMAVMNWRDRPFSRCPSCSQPTWHKQNRPVIIATGRCGYCGETVLAG